MRMRFTFAGKSRPFRHTKDDWRAQILRFHYTCNKMRRDSKSLSKGAPAAFFL
ncbi:hypothetical protein BURMUCF2_0706 [Burkholderia multivorans CF2]|nr:hypothetical protein BURMUCF2_0706 [Burkholderia multivorans CF2]